MQTISGTFGVLAAVGAVWDNYADHSGAILVLLLSIIPTFFFIEELRNSRCQEPDEEDGNGGKKPEAFP